MNQKAWRDAVEPDVFIDYVRSQRDEAFLPKVCSLRYVRITVLDVLLIAPLFVVLDS